MAYQVEQQDPNTGRWKVTDRNVTREYAEGTVAWVKRHGGSARVSVERLLDVGDRVTDGKIRGTVTYVADSDPEVISIWWDGAKRPRRARASWYQKAGG